jgi:hypothetical protein
MNVYNGISNYLGFAAVRSLLEPEHPEVATIEELYIADEQARWDPRDYWRMPLLYPRAS